MTDFILDPTGQILDNRYRSKPPGDPAEGNGEYPEEFKRFADDEQHDKNKNKSIGGEDHVDAEQPTISLRARTKYEEAILSRVPERQKANLVKKQVVLGKEYTGIGFLPDPGTVEFIDFDVGKTYKVKVHLTNVSRGYNAFKVHPVPPNVRDVLEVQYTPQGMLSAGLSCDILVIFTPKENIDIDTHIPILAQTGMIELPVLCRRKRVVVSVSTNHVDFGSSLVVAEKAVRVISVKNDGALLAKFTITGDFIELMKTMTHTDPAGNPHKVFTMQPEVHPNKPPSKPQRLLLRPFSEFQITMQFYPMEVCDVSSSIFLTFDNDEVQDKAIFVSARSVNVPVFVDHNSRMDFKAAVYECLYRDKFSVRNTTKAAVKVTPEIPPQLKGMLEFLPKYGYVQSNATFDFQVKFIPGRSLGKELDVAVRIVVTDQAMPIFFQLRSSLTERTIELDPPELNFGICTTNERLQLPLTITNKSRLMQRVGFVRLPANVHVDPNSVFTLAPNEKFTAQVSLLPLTAGQFTQSIQLLSDTDESHSIPVLGFGRAAVISFTQSVLQLPVCTVGECVSVSTVLKNCSHTMQRFAFTLNPKYMVQVSPQSGEIEAGASVPIVLTFEPNQEGIDLKPPDLEPVTTATTISVMSPTSDAKSSGAKDQKPPPPAKKKSKADEEAERKQKEQEDELAKQKREEQIKQREKLLEEYAKLQPWECSQSARGEPWSRHRELLLPCFVENWPSKAIFLSVRCCVVQPSVVCSLVASSADGGSSEKRSSNDKQQQAAPSTAGVPPAIAPAKGPAGKGSQTPQPPGTSRSPRTSIVGTSGQLRSPRQVTVVDESSSTVTSTGSCVTVNYGSVPADHAVTKTIHIQSHATNRVRLVVKPLDPFGPFKIVKPPLTQLLPGQATEFSLQFTPTRKAVYLCDLPITVVGANNLRILVKGEGLPAALGISLERPEGFVGGLEGSAAGKGAAAGKKEASSTQLNAPSSTTTAADLATRSDIPVDLGPCVVGDRLDVPLFFTNLSPFPLHIETKFDPTTIPNFNPNGSIPFALSPHRFTIPASGTVLVHGIFLPLADATFRATAHVEFGGERSVKHIHFSGIGCESGMYVQMPQQDHVPRALSDIHETKDGPLTILRRDIFRVFGDGHAMRGSRQDYPVQLQMVVEQQKCVDGQESSTLAPTAAGGGKGGGKGGVAGMSEPPAPGCVPAQIAITIGNNRTGANGEVSVEGLTEADFKNGWRVEPQRAPVPIGSKTLINVTFSPTQFLLESLPLQRVGIVSLCCFRLVVKGGVPAADQSTFVQLKGTVYRYRETATASS